MTRGSITGGLFVSLIGVVLLAQVLRGDAVARLGIFA